MQAWGDALRLLAWLWGSCRHELHQDKMLGHSVVLLLQSGKNSFLSSWERLPEDPRSLASAYVEASRSISGVAKLALQALAKDGSAMGGLSLHGKPGGWGWLKPLFPMCA